MYMIMLVLDNPDQLDACSGSLGARSAFVGRRSWRAPASNACGERMCPCAIFSRPWIVEEGHFTLFVIVEGEQMVQDCLHATEQIVRDLDEPNTGVFAAWPLALCAGCLRAPQGGQIWSG